MSMTGGTASESAQHTMCINLHATYHASISGAKGWVPNVNQPSVGAFWSAYLHGTD